MLAQYRATPEDFPPSFCTRCQQLDAFLQAVNRQLDGILYRRQYRARQQESRRMLRDQYLLLARYLQGAADAGLCGVEGEAQYTPCLLYTSPLPIRTTPTFPIAPIWTSPTMRTMSTSCLLYTSRCV